MEQELKACLTERERQIVAWRKALLEIERTYWMEGKTATWRAGRMCEIARDAIERGEPWGEQA